MRQYGWPNEKQDWKTAVRYRVDVNVDGGGVWNIKVFSADPVENPRKAYLLGSYGVNVMDGECSVYVDAPYTLRSLFVGIVIRLFITITARFAITLKNIRDLIPMRFQGLPG